MSQPESTNPLGQSMQCHPGGVEGLSSQLFKALADDCRLALLRQLAKGAELTVTEIAACCPQTLSVVSRHLKLLRDTGVITSVKQGKEVYYRFEPSRLAECFRQWADEIERPGID